MVGILQYFGFRIFDFGFTFETEYSIFEKYVKEENTREMFV